MARRRRGRRFNKRRTGRRFKRYGWRRYVKKLKAGLRSVAELKHETLQSNASALNANAQITLHSTIQGGTDDYQRVGNKIHLKNLTINLVIQPRSTSSGRHWFRVMLVRSDKELAVSDAPNIWGVNNYEKYFIMRDKRIYLPEYDNTAFNLITPAVMRVHWFVKLNHQMRFIDNLGAVPVGRKYYVWIIGAIQGTSEITTSYVISTSYIDV